MITRFCTYLTVLVSTAFGGALVASPAMAATLEEARRSPARGIGSFLGGVCCLIVVVLVGGGVLIGVLISRRRRNNG
jgi:hypothetical protein